MSRSDHRARQIRCLATANSIPPHEKSFQALIRPVYRSVRLYLVSFRTGCTDAALPPTRFAYHFSSDQCKLSKFALFTIYVSVTMDAKCPSLAIQVSPDPTPAEIIIVTVGKRNGCFQVSLCNGEGIVNLKFSKGLQTCYLIRKMWLVQGWGKEKSLSFPSESKP